MADNAPARVVSELDAVKAPRGRTFIEVQNALQFKTLAHLWALLSPISAEIAELLAFSAETPDLAGRLAAVEALAARAMDVRVTVADEAARLALTIAQVQNGDFVAQTSPSQLFEVVDETKLGTGQAADAFKLWNAADVDHLAAAPTNGQTISLTLTKPLTVLTLTLPANIAHVGIVNLTHATPGSIVIVSAVAPNSLSGTVHLRNSTGITTIRSFNLATWGSPQISVLRRNPALGGGGEWTQFVQTNGPTITNVPAPVYPVKPTPFCRTVTLTKQGGPKGYFELFYGTPQDGQQFSISVYDSNSSSYIFQQVFEWDAGDATLYDPSAYLVDISANPSDSSYCFNQLAGILAGYSFYSSIAQDPVTGAWRLSIEYQGSTGSNIQLTCTASNGAAYGSNGPTYGTQGQSELLYIGGGMKITRVELLLPAGGAAPTYNIRAGYSNGGPIMPVGHGAPSSGYLVVLPPVGATEEANYAEGFDLGQYVMAEWFDPATPNDPVTEMMGDSVKVIFHGFYNN